MQVLNNGPTPSAERSASPTEVSGEKRSNADEEASQETKLTFVPSFETMYQSKARAAQISTNAKAAESASSQEGGAEDE